MNLNNCILFPAGNKLNTFSKIFGTFLLIMGSSINANAQWLDWQDETATGLVLNSVADTDGQEKDFAVGDLDQNGFIDVVVVRKNPFSTPGADADLLLMNDGSQLVDMTATLAPEFISDPTDSRDVFIGDFDGDGWEDVVVASTFSDQPSYYRNLGNDVNGDWQGLTNESATRFPFLNDGGDVLFCAVWGGDIDGDGSMDLYFTNYNQNPSLDYLLINDGNGFFTNETSSRLGDLRNSAFGTSCEIHDMDNDGDLDIVKISTLFSTAPFNAQGVFILYNDGTGNFNNFSTVTNSAPYMFTVADFNQDGWLDVYLVSDGADRMHLSNTVTPDIDIVFDITTYNDSPRTTGFGGNVKTADFDNDGDLDIGLADVDVDIPPCESGAGSLRKYTNLRNDGGQMSDPEGTNTNIWNQSTYDFALADFNNDGLVDILQGRCNSYALLIQSSAGVELNLKSFLQGPYDATSGLMSDGLRANGQIPLDEPYSALGYTVPAASTNLVVLGETGNDAIVDWVLVELRSLSDPTLVIESQAAIIQRDGDIVAANGGPLLMDVQGETEVYVALRHRNHFGIRVADSFAVSAGITIDFSDPALNLFGASPMELISGNNVQVSGNANNDGQINTIDRNLFWRVQNGQILDYITFGSDFNLDGSVNSVDRNLHWRINNSRIEQLD